MSIRKEAYDELASALNDEPYKENVKVIYNNGDGSAPCLLLLNDSDAVKATRALALFEKNNKRAAIPRIVGAAAGAAAFLLATAEATLAYKSRDPLFASRLTEQLVHIGEGASITMGAISGKNARWYSRLVRTAEDTEKEVRQVEVDNLYPAEIPLSPRRRFRRNR